MKNTQGSNLPGTPGKSGEAERKLSELIVSGKEMLVSLIRGPSLADMRDAHQRGWPSVFYVISSSAAVFTREAICEWQETGSTSSIELSEMGEIVMIAVHFGVDVDRPVLSSLEKGILPAGNGFVLHRARNFLSKFPWHCFSVQPCSVDLCVYDHEKKGVLGDLFISGRRTEIEQPSVH